MKIGINVMSSIIAMREDFDGCVKKLKDGGCDYFEAMSDWGAKQETIDFYAGFTGGYSGWDPDNTEKRIDIMKKYDMGIKGMFIFEDLIEEQAEKMGQYCKKNGITYVVLSFLQYGDIDDIYEKIGKIKRLSAIIRKYGIKILIHNHEHDMLLIKDKDGKEKQTISIFLEQCTKDELMMESDTGWLKYAGLDEVKYVEENLDRIEVLHLKDICTDYETISRDDVFVACGKGCVDFAGVIAAAKKKPEIMYVLDQDASKGDIIEDTIQSIKYIKDLS